MEIYVARVKGSQQGSQEINVPLSFFGDEHLIFYRCSVSHPSVLRSPP